MQLATSTCDRRENARPEVPRRAFTLLELLVVLTIVGVLSGMAAVRFGDGLLGQTSAEGYVRRLALDLRQTRRTAIATGDVCRLALSSTGGAIVSYRILRQASGGDVAVDEAVATPDGVVVASDYAAWSFDFDGALTAASPSGSLRVDGPNSYWVITLFGAGGSVETARYLQP
ncbi:hypothetical protein Pla175_33090 [Pirellulimonas nuda]|uniref:Type II secretion system protein H n=1 Tax=Pirellulimonas nuda TaxID=2528009 RepID=A0A518DEQ1_9BACT|nr:GspH/FimT family pseudopilin [Pirellulimonas nuda]QDU89912.1 hypothetical protein Pla175_33090 [Pirellulimonas nuda]